MNLSMPSVIEPEITFSIVSHGQGKLIEKLLVDIEREITLAYEIILTLNIPEDECFISGFSFPSLFVIRNAYPKGFGANHNFSFKKSSGKFFLVINPDIRFYKLQLDCLLQKFSTAKVGVCGPAVYSREGKLEDSVRKFPTLLGLLKRRLPWARSLDYLEQKEAFFVDWLAGMFLIFSREAFQSVNGFDERYFMYMEDVDICKRLKSSGWSICYEPSAKVIHDARRASHKSFRHLWWHLRSIYVYFFNSRADAKPQRD
jgi:N-acetylglucosaminyl-diphospho-decaprenol L-rhamnosyltransferase